MKRFFSIALAAAALSVTMSMTALASYQFKSDETTGRDIFYEVQEETGEESVYSGWYEMPDSGEYLYFVDGVMKTGWITDGGKFYYLDPKTGYLLKNRQVQSFYLGEDGAALIDTTAPDGTELAYNGSIKRGNRPAEELNEKTFGITEALKECPDSIAHFGGLDGGKPSFMKENVNGFTFYTFKGVTLYGKDTNGKSGAKLFEGDACFRTNAKIEIRQKDGSIQIIRPAALQKAEYQNFSGRVFTDPAGCIEYVKAVD